jgi:hypothetical protein
MNTWITHIRDGRKEKTACQEATEANPEKMDPNPGEKDIVVRQEIPKEEVAVYSIRACRNERKTCQGAAETNSEKMVQIDRAIAVIEQMITVTNVSR